MTGTPGKTTRDSLFTVLEILFNNSYFCYIVAIIVPLTLAFSWYNLNTFFPMDDAANYFETAQNIYLQYKLSGIEHAILTAYFDRGWRPIIFPVLAAPFFGITDGNILSTVSTTIFFFFFIFLTYTYLISKEFLSPLSSALSTLFIGTLYWVFNYSLVFMSEILLMVCVLAALYHFLKSSFFTSLKHSIFFGLWLALGLAVRPVEFFLAFGVLIFFLIYISYKKQNVNTGDLVATASLLIFSVLLLLAEFYSLFSFNILVFFWLIIALFSLFLLFFSKKFGLNLPYLFAISISNLFASGWWLHDIHDLYSWAFAGSFEPLTRLYIGDSNLAMGFCSLSFITCLAIFGIVSTRGTKDLLNKNWSYFIAVFTVILFPFTLVILNITNNRHAVAGFLVLFLTITIISLHQKLRFPKLRSGLMIIFIVTQILVISGGIYGFIPNYPRHIESYLQSTNDDVLYRGSPLLGGDPSAKLFQEINELPLGRVNIAAFTLAVNSAPDRPFDPQTLNVLAKKYNSTLHFGYPWQFIDLEDGYESLSTSGYEYVLVDITTDSSISSKSSVQPYSRLTSDIIAKWNHSTLETVGLSYVTDFHISNKTILLLMVQQPGESKLSFKDNIGLTANGGVPGATSDQIGFPSNNLNDGTDAPWGSIETINDTFFYITRNSPYRAKSFRVELFSTPEGAHIRDLSVVATNDSINGNENWKILRSRINSSDSFTEKITSPNWPDRSVIKIEMDITDPNWDYYKTYGLSCFSQNNSYNRNYVSVGNGIYLRELQISEIDKS